MLDDLTSSDLHLRVDWEYVLDASAVLAYLFNENGADVVEPLLGNQSVISAVNFAEVLKTILYVATDPQPNRNLHKEFAALGVRIIHFDAEQAAITADLYRRTKRIQLGLGDRACLALAVTSKCHAVTGDQEWRKLPSDIRVLMIRGQKSSTIST